MDKTIFLHRIRRPTFSRIESDVISDAVNEPSLLVTYTRS